MDGFTQIDAVADQMNPDKPNVIANGECRGKALSTMLNQHPEYLATKVKNSELLVLVMYTVAKQDLSVQVHQDDAYAKEHKDYNAKTEMRYAIDEEELPYLIFRFQV